MNNNYGVVLAEEFLGLLDGKWRFIGNSVSYKRTEGTSLIYGSKKVGPIKKILIVPTCTEKCEDGNSPSIEEIFREIQKANTESSILLIGTCCGIRKDKIERLREMTTQNVLIPNQFSLNRKSLKEQVESLATVLRSDGLMQKMDWC